MTTQFQAIISPLLAQASVGLPRPDMYALTAIAAVAAVAAVLVPLYIWWHARRLRWHFGLVEVEPRSGNSSAFRVTFRNDGDPDINVARMASIVILDARKPNIEASKFRFAEVGGRRVDSFPHRLRTDDEMTFTDGKNQIADNLRMQNCWDTCRVRVVVRNKRGREFRSEPFVIPVEQWLDPDATARTLNPRP